MERTIEMATADRAEKLHIRLEDTSLWAHNFTILVKRMLSATQTKHDFGEFLSESIDELLEMEFPCEALQSLITDPAARAALVELDVNLVDRMTFSILIMGAH